MLKTFVITAAIRGHVTYLVKNCKTREEARQKLADCSSDVEGVNTDIDQIFYASALVREDKPR